MKFLTSTPWTAGAILALALAVLGAADWAAAQPTEQQVAAIKSACRSDYMSYCWSVPRGGAEALQCLKKNVASLSDPCQQAVKAATTTAAAPSGSGTAANAAKPATVTKPAAAAAATSPSPAETENAAKSAPAGATSSAAAAPTQNGAANSAAPTESAAASNATAAPGSSASAASSQDKAATKKKSSTTSSQASAQGAAAAASTGAAASGAAKKKQTTETTAPVSPAATGAAMPSALGFILPRKKFMLARFCRDDFNAHCPGVDLGGGRAIQCLEDNMASLAPQCRDALVKLGR